MSSMEDDDSFSSFTAIVFAVVSLILYFMFLRPTITPTQTPQRNNLTTTTTTRRRNPNAANNNAPNNGPPPSWNNTNDRPRSTHLSEAAFERLSSCRTTPVHVATPQDKVGIGGTCVLVDGLVAFSHTPAALVVAASTDASSLRSERAKLLSRLVLATLNHNNNNNSNINAAVPPPPPKGSTLVVALSSNDHHLDHPIVSRSLYVLGTWYNLLVIVAVSDAKEDKDAIVSKLNVKEQVLPKHRILLAQTVTGRVALVRQLSRVELVVDWDKEVSSQLERFGYKVALVPNGLGSVLDDE